LFVLQVITKLLYLLHQGETFTKVRATCSWDVLFWPAGRVAIKHAASWLGSIDYSQQLLPAVVHPPLSRQRPAAEGRP
jgi:hypothetical protein